MNIERILLIYPPTNNKNKAREELWMLEPLGLEYVAAACEGRNVRIHDMRHDPDIFKTIIEFKPDLVGFTALTCHVNTVIRLIKYIKNVLPDCMIMVGGQHATVRPADFELPEVDLIIRGDGYGAVQELAEYDFERKSINGISFNINNTFTESVIRDYSGIKDRPFPKRELTKKYNYNYGWHWNVSSIQTSAGCPYKCKFCSTDALTGGIYVNRSIGSVVEEIKTIESKVICFTDDECWVDCERMMALAEEIKSKGIKKRYIMFARINTIVKNKKLFQKWKEIGLDDLMVGYEYISSAKLIKSNKGNPLDAQKQATNFLKDIGVMFTPLFIVDPDFDREDFNNLKVYAQKQRFFSSDYSVLTPFPGTAIYQELKGQIQYTDWDMFDGVHTVLKTKLPEETFYDLYWGLFFNISTIKKIKIFFKYPVWYIPDLGRAFIISKVKELLKTLKKQ